MSYTLAEAATAAGVYTSTVLRAIKSGKISGTKNEMGEWVVEPAELHRVYPPVARSDADTNATQRYAPGDIEAGLRAAMLEERVADLKTALADMRAQRDSWQQVAERLALAPPVPKPASVPTVTVVARRPWWSWRRAG
jgi:hypothetical protein